MLLETRTLSSKKQTEASSWVLAPIADATPALPPLPRAYASVPQALRGSAAGFEQFTFTLCLKVSHKTRDFLLRKRAAKGKLLGKPRPASTLSLTHSAL